MPLQTFKVTKEIMKKSHDLDINGKMSALTECPIALVIRDKYPLATVGISVVDLDTKTHSLVLPREVSRFISKFCSYNHDNPKIQERLDVPEFEFTLDIP